MNNPLCSPPSSLMFESANLLPHQPQSKQCSPVHSADRMCKQRTADLSTTDPEDPTTTNLEHSNMDAHILLDIFTLCVVASLFLILILTKVIKKEETTSVNQIDRDTNIKPRSQHGRLHLQDLLRAVQLAGPHGTPGTEPATEHQLPQDGGDPAHPERGTQPGEDSLAGCLPFVPVILKTNPDVFKSNYSTLSVYIVVISLVGRA